MPGTPAKPIFLSLTTLICKYITVGSLLLTIAAMTGCGQQDDNSAAVQTDRAGFPENEHSELYEPWTDSLLADYIDRTDNQQIKQARADTLPEQWLFDGLHDREHIGYIVFQIGHDEKAETDKRFVADAWVYIDKATRQLYEYDLANDSLVKWEKQRR